MALTSEDVAALARLARIDLTDEELAQLAPQLDVILESVAHVSDVAADDIPPTSHALPLTNVFRADVTDSVAAAGRGAGGRAGRRAGPLPGAADPGGGSVIIHETAERLAAQIKSGERSSVEVTQAHLDRIAAVDGAVHAFLHVDGERALARAAAVDAKIAAGETARPAGRRTAGPEGRPHLPRRADDVRVEDPPGLAAALRRRRHRAAARRRPGHPGQDQHGRVRHGLLHRELRLRPDPQPVGPGPDSGRLRGRVLGRAGCVRGAAGHRHRHRGVDPAAGFGDRHRRGQADLRGHVALRPGGAGLQPGPGRALRAYGAGRRAAASGHRRTRPPGLDLDRRPRPRRGGRGPLRRRDRTEDRRGDRARRRGLRPGSAAAVHRGGRPARRPRRGDRRGLLPALRLRPGRLLPDPAQRGVVQPGQVRRHALRAPGRRRRHAECRGGDGR